MFQRGAATAQVRALALHLCFLNPSKAKKKKTDRPSFRTGAGGAGAAEEMNVVLFSVSCARSFTTSCFSHSSPEFCFSELLEEQELLEKCTTTRTGGAAPAKPISASSELLEKRMLSFSKSSPQLLGRCSPLPLTGCPSSAELKEKKRMPCCSKSSAPTQF
ncbi:hypothetical protein SRHO_G00154180 [Serrasalmus rhombeus]